jgi:hypothetical protein
VKQLNAISGPKGIPPAVVKENEDGEKVYVIPNKNGQDFILGSVNDDATKLLARLDVKLGAAKTSTASGDSIVLGNSPITEN